MGLDVSKASGSDCALAEVIDLVCDGGHVGCMVTGASGKLILRYCKRTEKGCWCVCDS